jgi:hypothetical protein
MAIDNGAEMVINDGEISEVATRIKTMEQLMGDRGYRNLEYFAKALRRSRRRDARLL